MKSILLENKYQSRVSSVLNKDVQQYGKKYLFDNNDETCWCSDQSSPQWISLMFENVIQVSGIELQFQGGFVGKDCKIIASSKDGGSIVTPFYPEDINTVQTFHLADTIPCSKLTLNFDSSTDFFGRIIVYKLDIMCNVDYNLL